MESVITASSDKVCDESIDQVALVEYLEPSLLLYGVASFRQLDDKSIFIGFLVQTRFEGVKDPHCRSDYRLAQFLVNHFIRDHPCYPWFKSPNRVGET